MKDHARGEGWRLADWDEDRHQRDTKGRFAPNGGDRVEHLGTLTQRATDERGNVTSIGVQHPGKPDLTHHYAKKDGVWTHISDGHRTWDDEGDAHHRTTPGSGKVSKAVADKLDKVTKHTDWSYKTEVKDLK